MDVKALSRRTAFRAWFGLEPQGAEVLAALYGAAGKPMTKEELALAAGVGVGAVPYHLFHVRSALECEAIDSTDGGGARAYRLTEGGIAECRAAMRSIGKELLEAA